MRTCRVFAQTVTYKFTLSIYIALQDPFGVTIGSIVGHAICTAIAVIGGKLIAQKISPKTVTIIGGLVFLLFSFTALLHNPNSDENTTYQY